MSNQTNVAKAVLGAQNAGSAKQTVRRNGFLIGKMTLEKHLFISTNFTDIEPLVRDMADKSLKRVNETGAIRSKEPVSLAPKEHYCVTVFQKAQLLLDCFNRLEKTIIFMKRFPSPKTYEKQGINRFEWLEYHYSYFVLTYVSIYDTALILVNTVFRLGNPEKNCTTTTIRENSWVKKTNAYQALKGLDKIIQPYRFPRNVHVHRGDLPNIKEKADFDTMDMIQMVDTAHIFSEQIMERDLLQLAYDDQTLLLVENLKEDIEQGKEVVSQLFDSLEPIYQNKATKLLSDYA